MAAVSGNAADKVKTSALRANHTGRIERALGIHHAVGAKINLLLMTGSFAISGL